MQPDQMTVVLTGACGGIGQILARKLAAEGASLFLCGRDAETLAALQKVLRAKAVDDQYIDARAVDLTDDREIDQWLESIAQSGRPVNVAGQQCRHLQVWHVRETRGSGYRTDHES